MKKRIISLLLVFAMLVTLLPTGAMAVETAAKDSGANPFSDVKSTDWFYDAVRYAGEKGFFSGTSATTFEPYGTMTRGMFVTVLGRMAGVNAGDYTGVTGFSDVPEAVYYAPYVAWAAQYGITGGTGDGKFSPNAFINRQQMAAFFVRYFEAFGVNYETGANITTTPADLDTVAPYARDAVLKLWKQGLLNGDGVNFSPTGSATRAQASTLCMRTDKTVPVWYSAPGVEGRTGGAASTAPAKPEQKPGNSSGSSSSGGSSSGGGTTTTTYYAVKFELGKDQPATQLPGERTIAAGTPISSLPTPSKPGVVFLGWYYDKEMTRSVGAGDTVTRNMTLYASIAGEELQSIETPNYVTKTDVDADTPFTFGVEGVTITESNKADVLSFINITDVNTPVDFRVSGSTVSATLEAGQTYKVELLDEKAKFVLDGTEQDTSVRVLNILTAKAKVTNAKLNEDVKQVLLSDTKGLAESVFKGLYQIDDTQTVSENTTSGTFTYTGDPLTVGQTLAVTDNKNGTVDLKDVTSDSGDVAYIKITGVNGNKGYSYEMADVEDVLFIPDVLPIQNGWDTDSSKNTVTISAENLNTALNNVDAAGLDEGDFLAFINGAYNENGTASSYGRVTAFAQSGEDYVITYVDATENDIESALDVYYEEKKDIEVSEEEKEQIAESVTQGIEESGYAEKAASYVMAVMEESGGLDTAPDPAAVAAYMDTISTYARADGSIVLYAGGRKAEAKVDWSRVRVSIDRYADHLKGGGFDIEVTVPITLEMDSVTVDFTAVFEEEVILGQSISTKRHKIGFLKYDYSLNASFDIGNYTGIHFKADVRTQDGGNDESLSKKLDEILDKMEAYGGLLESGGVSGTDGTMESLSDIYKEVMDSASDAWVDVINQKLFENNGSAFLHIFCWQIKGSFVVSVNMAVTMGMDFEYTTRKRYNFSVRVKAKTSTNETIDLITPNYTFNFYVIGTIGVRAGLRLEMYVGLISLKIDRIGIVAEVGVYTQLWGYFFYHLEWKQGAGKKSNSAGALLIEIGMYLDIKFVATLFNSNKLTWAPTIYANQWPLWSAGQRQNVFAFADDGSGGKYELKTVKTLALPGSTYTMKSMDLKTGGIGAVNKDDNSESAFAIAFTNPHFSYNAATNTVTVNPAAGSLNEETDMVITWKKAAMAFTSKPIQKTLHIKWSDPEGMRYISFDSMGGSAVAQITGGEGARINWPADPTKPGYTFAGWYKNPSFENSRMEKMNTMPQFLPGTKGMLLFAKWTPAEAGYTVEHYQEALNGTYTLETKETKSGLTESRTMAAAKTYTGFTAKAFDQQTIAADGSTVVKIYYDRNQYTVTWKPENGTENIVQTCKYGAELTPPTVGREGYLFIGWDVTLPETVTGDAVYTARWEGVQNPVTFNAMGGSETAAATTVRTGECITKPADPTRDGYAFGGWYSDQNCTKKWDFSTEVTGAVTLFAKWTASAYTVTLNPMDGQLMGDSTRTVTFGQPYGELPTPTLQGYNFAGWYTANDDSGKKVEADTVVETAGAHTLYAKWTPGDVAYTVKHLWQNVEDNEYTEHESDSLTGTVMTETAAKAKTYEGFGPAKEFAQTTIAPDGTTVIEIKYDRLTYTVTWKNGETLLETDENVKYGAKPQYDGPAPEKTETGHTITFSGWNTAADGTDPMPDNFTVTGDVTYYAQFSDSLNTYRIAYQNMGDAENPNPDSYTYGTAVTLADPTRTGYSFDGWYRNSDAAGDPVTDISATETGNKTFYAKWTANTYTVTFDVNGGDALNGDSTLTVTYDQPYGTLPTPTKEGSAFDGWYTDAAAGEKVTAGTTVRIVEDQTLYAHWTAQSYTITFKTAGGSEVEPITGTFGTPITKPADPTRTGYTFTGWDKEIPAAMPAKDMTVTARWTANTYTVTLNPTGGTVADESITVTYGETYGTLPTPVRQGCTFTGWFTGEDGSKVESGTPVSRTEDHTLYAHWVEDATKYDLWIGGVQVTGGSAQDVFGDGTVSYDPDRNILTLDNYSYTGDGTASISNATIGDACLGYKGSETQSETLTIKLVGTNRLTFNGNSTFSNGIYIQRANLVIEGPGSLTVDVAGTMPDGVSYYRSFSICVTEMKKKGGTMTINGGTITTTGDAINKANVGDGTHGSSIGLAAQTLIVNGGSLTARGGDVDLAGGKNIFASSCGISVPYNKLTINGGSVTASCGTARITAGEGSEGMSAFDYQPILGEGITAQVSTNGDGSGATAYDANVNQDVFRTYRWFHASSNP